MPCGSLRGYYSHGLATARRIGCPLYLRTHSPGTPCGCSDCRMLTIDGALSFLRGPFSLIALVVLARRCWGLGTPPPSLKRAEG